MPAFVLVAGVPRSSDNALHAAVVLPGECAWARSSDGLIPQSAADVRVPSQIGYGKQGLHLSAILDQAPVASFHVPELTFDHAERMLDCRANQRLDVLDPLGKVSQHLILYALHRAASGRDMSMARAPWNVTGGTEVADVVKGGFLVAMQ